jgi:Ca2+-binding RTX toxin-like protein
VNQTGWTQTSPTTPYAVNLTAGQALTGINFGNNRQVNKNFTTTPKQDIIDAGAGDNTVTSTFANLQQQDAIKGGAGIDTLIINEGVATNAVIINASNTANQFNIPGTTITGFERFDLSGFLGKVTYTGTTGNDSIKTGAGADVLNGGAGIDTLIGGTGNDTYVVDTTTDVITENANEGTDTIQSSVTFSLATLTNIENI